MSEYLPTSIVPPPLKQSKKWKKLNDDDMSIIFDKFDFNECQIAGEYLDLFSFAKAIEQKLKEKNT